MQTDFGFVALQCIARETGGSSSCFLACPRQCEPCRSAPQQRGSICRSYCGGRLDRFYVDAHFWILLLAYISISFPIKTSAHMCYEFFEFSSTKIGCGFLPVFCTPNDRLFWKQCGGCSGKGLSVFSPQLPCRIEAHFCMLSFAIVGKSFSSFLVQGFSS